MRRLPPFLAVALFLVPVTLTAQAGAEEPYAYSVPERIGDGWDVGDVREAGVDLQRLEQLVTQIRNATLPNLHSVLIIKDGRLIFEEYFAGDDEHRGEPLGTVPFDRTILHDLRSVTKSVTSALVGIAAEKGALSPSDSVFSFFADQSFRATDDKHAITIRHLLTMTSGLEWDESTHPYTDPRNSETAMDLSESSVAYVLGQQLVAEPGARFQYCGGCTMLLAGAVNAATGTHLDEFAEEHLFLPLGITEFEWLHHQDGLPVAASGLRLKPRDMAKFGYLFVNDGRWKDRQIVPASWVRESTREQVRLDSISAYGYQWWVDLEPLNGEVVAFPVARGNGGQRIYVVPSLDLVAVITAGNYNSAASRFSEQAFWRYVLPAAASAREN